MNRTQQRYYRKFARALVNYRRAKHKGLRDRMKYWEREAQYYFELLGGKGTIHSGYWPHERHHPHDLAA